MKYQGIKGILGLRITAHGKTRLTKFVELEENQVKDKYCQIRPDDKHAGYDELKDDISDEIDSLVWDCDGTLTSNYIGDFLSDLASHIIDSDWWAGTVTSHEHEKNAIINRVKRGKVVAWCPVPSDDKSETDISMYERIVTLDVSRFIIKDNDLNDLEITDLITSVI